jgi:hypothetical protein
MQTRLKLIRVLGVKVYNYITSADVVPLAEKRPSATLLLPIADLPSLSRDTQACREALQDIPMSINKYGSQNDLRDKPSNINSLVMMGRPREKATQHASYHRTKSENDQQNKAPFFSTALSLHFSIP